MDASKMSLLTSTSRNDSSMERNIESNSESSIMITRRDGPLAQQLANKLSIVANTNSSM